MGDPEASGPTVEGIDLVPLGPWPEVEPLAARLSRRVRVPCRVSAAWREAELPWLAERGQLDARALLSRLAARAAPGRVSLGLTALDLGLPVFTFVFGLAQSAPPAAVVSRCRLDPRFYGLSADPRAHARRALDETLHELGHVAGLRHCRAAECLMRFAAGVDQVDARGGAFCDACRTRLPAWLGPASAWP